MIVLGIESATESVGAAVSDGEGSGASFCVTGRRRHAENLAPAIAQVLERAGIGLERLEAIAVDVGPGLFTGLRVGVATAKGLAQGLGIGVLGVTSLEILASAAFEAGWPGTVAPVIDGRRGEVFAAHYARGLGPAELVELSAPARYWPERVVPELAVPETGGARVRRRGVALPGPSRHRAGFGGRGPARGTRPLGTGTPGRRPLRGRCGAPRCDRGAAAVPARGRHPDQLGPTGPAVPQGS